VNISVDGSGTSPINNRSSTAKPWSAISPTPVLNALIWVKTQPEIGTRRPTDAGHRGAEPSNTIRRRIGVQVIRRTKRNDRRIGRGTWDLGVRSGLQVGAAQAVVDRDALVSGRATRGIRRNAPLLASV